MGYFGNDWDNILKEELSKDYFVKLREYVLTEYATKTIYPPKEMVFNAFKYTSYKDIKVVIIGQDPYHEPNQAMGLAFSVNKGIALPPSLKNIYKEIANEYNEAISTNGDLTYLAKQGVLLLNNVLTVRKGFANSHKDHGWEIFTNDVISLINQKEEPVVFLLWGNDAKQKASLITNKKHCILTTTHPSPLSAYAGFFGCGHFIKANEFLEKNEKTPIRWTNKG